MLYILQFEQPLGNPENRRAQARYYMGYCDDDRLDERITEHLTGRGAAITRAAVARGISFEVVAVLPGSRDDERRFKKRYKNTPRLVERLRKKGVARGYATRSLRL